MPREISYGLLENYITLVLDYPLDIKDMNDEKDIMPKGWSDYLSGLEELKKGIKYNLCEDEVLLGIEYLISNPEVNLDDYNSHTYAIYEPEDIRQILIKIHKYIWPDRPIPSTPPDIEIVPTTYQQWKEKQGYIRCIKKGDTLRKIAKVSNLSTDEIKKSNWFTSRGYNLDDELPEGRVINLRVLRKD